VVVTNLAGFDGGGELGEFGRQWRPGQAAPRPDPRGQPKSALDFPAGDAQSRPQQIAHGGVGRQRGIVGPIDRAGHLAEHPIRQPPVDPSLGLEACGDLDAKRVAHHIGISRTQPHIRSIDEVEVGPDLRAGRLGGKQELIGERHAPILSNNRSSHSRKTAICEQTPHCR
jgi:hypothetical protein